MKTKYLNTFLALTLFEGILAEIYLLRMKFDPGRGTVFNYSSLRIGLAGGIFLVLLTLIGLWIRFHRNLEWTQRISCYLDEKLIGRKRRLFVVQGALIITLMFLIECFLLTYLAFPIPLRSFFVWAALICFQVWLCFRIVYAAVYRQRPSLAFILGAKWRAWLPVQRKVFFILAVLGLIYFLAYVPSNLLSDADGRFFIASDEAVIYPDVATVLISQDTFDAAVHNVVESWPWWYGYPYVPISAVVLIIPRLIFGNEFIQQIQLNIFLLRQFVSILPMILALFTLVYLVTRFKSLAWSVFLFIFLLLIPGVVKYNYRFWHPDGIILLLVVLTFYFLQKDGLRFGRFFYLAAVTCGLATAIKLFGLFFVLTIGGYLLTGLIQRILNFRKMVLAGLSFLLLMVATIIISSPSLMAPYLVRGAVQSWQGKNVEMIYGYNEPDPTGDYQTGLPTWLRFFDLYYMKSYFFFFSCFALVAGSIWGSQTYLNRILLTWSLVIGGYLVFFVAVKSYHYMMPLMVPLHVGVFLFPALADGKGISQVQSFLARPLSRKLLWAVTIVLCGSQLVFNIIAIFTSPIMTF